MNQRELHRIADQLPWPDNYYERLDGAERKILLDEALKEENSKENQYRLQLWELRYGKVKSNHGKPKTDSFLKLWMDLEYASRRIGAILGMKAIVRPIRKDMELMGMNDVEEYQPYGAELLYKELVQLGRFYYEICANDKTYTSGAFGLSKISDEQFVQKITNDVYHICYETPKAFGVEEELRLFTEAMTEALEMDYPGQKAKLMRAVREHL